MKFEMCLEKLMNINVGSKLVLISSKESQEPEDIDF